MKLITLSKVHYVSIRIWSAFTDNSFTEIVMFFFQFSLVSSVHSKNEFKW
jgi:hypothetical protein